MDQVLDAGGPAARSGVTNQLNVMKAIGAIAMMPGTAEGVLWNERVQQVG